MQISIWPAALKTSSAQIFEMLRNAKAAIAFHPLWSSAYAEFVDTSVE
jgi:hypothetical protein